MLKTALKPQWILALIGALLVASGFVFLSQWQFERSQEAAPPPVSATETPVPLTEHFEPGAVMLATDADQVVSASGSFLLGKQTLVRNRLNDGEPGYWVVAPFAVDGAPDDAVVPVVRGWQAEASMPAPAPAGTLDVVGRLLPTEAPIDEKPGTAGLPSLSVAQLINEWDVVSYSGFVVAFDVRNDAGASAGAESTGLVPVNVGPQPQEREINWLNVFYGIEWVVFAGFAVFLWTRLVADDYRRQQEELQDAREAEAAAAAEPLDAPGRSAEGEDPASVATRSAPSGPGPTGPVPPSPVPSSKDPQ